MSLFKKDKKKNNNQAEVGEDCGVNPIAKPPRGILRVSAVTAGRMQYPAVLPSKVNGFFRWVITYRAPNCSIHKFSIENTSSTEVLDDEYYVHSYLIAGYSLSYDS